MQTFEPGPLTDEQVKQIKGFQSDELLTVDGKIGRETWGAMMSLYQKSAEEILQLDNGIEELQDLVTAAEDRANELACENSRLMLGLEDTRGSSCVGCGFVGVFVGAAAVWALVAFI
jgi:hypothetical protein